MSEQPKDQREMSLPVPARLVLTVGLILSVVTDAPAVEPSGRYQAIPLGETHTLIIDTQTGNVWKWFDGIGNNNSQGGSGIRYEGAAVPGDRPGEIIARQGFGLPAIQRPAGKQ